MIAAKKALIVVAILVLAAVMIVPIGTSDVVDSPFGQWKVGIRAVGKDGSVTPLSIVNTIGGQILSVSGPDIDVNGSLEFYISAKATGEGYTQCEIDMTDVEFTPYIPGGCPFDAKYGSKVTIDVGDSDFTEIYTYTLTAEQIECDALDLGTHTLTFESTGTVRYRGLPGGETQTISSIPSAETTITIEEPDEDPPEDPPDECTYEYKHEYGSWSDMGCVGDGKRKQTRIRTTYRRYRCPDETSVPNWEYAWEDNQYRTISDSSCDEPDPCIPYTTYGDWTNWVYDRCEGATRYDYRTRMVTTYTCPGHVAEQSIEKKWRHYIDKRACDQMQIIKVSPIFTVIGAVAQGSYYMDSEHYLGTRD